MIRPAVAAGAVTVLAALTGLIVPVAPQQTHAVDPATLLTATTLPAPDPHLLDLPGLPDLPDPAWPAASIGESIESLYLTLEQWSQYGANLLSWAVGWVPFLGVLAPQVNFFYDLGQAITHSMVFNTAELLDGTIDFNRALNNISADTNAAFTAFFDTQASWLQGLLPPPPPPADAVADLSPDPAGALLSLDLNLGL